TKTLKSGNDFAKVAGQSNSRKKIKSINKKNSAGTVKNSKRVVFSTKKRKLKPNFTQKNNSGNVFAGAAQKPDKDNSTIPENKNQFASLETLDDNPPAETAQKGLKDNTHIPQESQEIQTIDRKKPPMQK
ncbi:hypothetical protein COBT_001334, partial [Conglomerata obtusa]